MGTEWCKWVDQFNSTTEFNSINIYTIDRHYGGYRGK